ncbi:hypothetical protein PG997_014999 [Apiospora hydei]|uniref:Uncharacterized protein n=1 Tax=Apiospora hydei TaxID=1337664 RepID=A0ABR1UW60_9PEZI
MTSRTGIFTSAVSVETDLVTTTDINGQKSGLGSGAIAGIVVGAVVGVAILAALSWLIFRHRRKARGRPSSSARQTQEINSHRGPDDIPEPEPQLDQLELYRKEDRYELGEPDRIPQQRQEQYQKPELDASTSEVLHH